MAITADLVKQLRERTGAGMMECKKALVETQGDLDNAVEFMRKQGLAKADKKADRIAAEGRVIIAVAENGAQAVLLEVNCETDFVAGGDDFRNFCDQVAQSALTSQAADLNSLLAIRLSSGETIEDAQKSLIAKIGEKIAVRRYQLVPRQGDRFGVYLHGARIGVLVDVQGGDDVLAKDLAMHIAASRPLCVAPADVSEELVAKEREIFAAQASESGKPADIVAKMVEGRVRKYLNEVALLGQPFVKDPEITVERLLKQANAKVLSFVRLGVGEGIEKKVDNFAAEVMAQVRGN